jgi:hypothetical protein
MTATNVNNKPISITIGTVDSFIYQMVPAEVRERKVLDQFEYMAKYLSEYPMAKYQYNG